MAEWSKAPDSSSGPRERAWVQIPLLTLFSGFFFPLAFFGFLFLQISFPLTILHFSIFIQLLIMQYFVFIGRGDGAPRVEFFFKFIFCTYLKIEVWKWYKSKMLCEK